MPARESVLRRNENRDWKRHPPRPGRHQRDPGGRLGASVPALVDAPGAAVMARPEEHQTGGKGHEYHTAA
jgi:hypothetical protein